MAFEDTDRRRALLLGLLTLIALPAIYLVTRSDSASDTDAGVAVVGDTSLGGTVPGNTSPGVTVPGAVAPGNGPSRPPVQAPDDEPVYMEGPVSDQEPGVAEVAVPARPDQPPIEMSASYRSDVGPTTCLVSDVDSGLEVTIRHLDNGRAIICTTATAPENQVAGIVLSTQAFSLLADLTEAPIPVDVIR